MQKMETKLISFPLRILLFFASCGVLFFPFAGWGQQSFNVIDTPWAHQRFPTLKANKYHFKDQGIDILSQDSVSLLYRGLDEKFWHTSSASWRWRVMRTVPSTDLKEKGTDDRNIAVYFLFVNPKQVRRFKNASISTILGHRDTRTLIYVWGGMGARNELTTSPYMRNNSGTIIYKRPARTGVFDESVDLRADLARAYPHDTGMVLFGLALSSDSDDTNSIVRARVENWVIKNE